MTNGNDEIAQWISGLADADPLAREASALRLYRAGELLCSLAWKGWIDDQEFRELVRPFAITTAGEPGSERTPFVIGVAVQPGNFEKIRIANGSPRLAEVPPDQDAIEIELRFGDRSPLDILTTSEPGGSGAIARYLQKFGEGIQQIEVNVTGVDRASRILRDRFGLSPIYPATRPGADGTRVNFFLVPAPDGKKVLIELVEPPAKTW